MKIAIVGAHGSGKSTIITSVYSELKKEGVRVALAPEVARSSLFLAAKEITPKMQMDLFGRQISCEMTNSRNCDLLLCDRSLFDILMYTRIFFEDNIEAISYTQSMSAFCVHYKETYDHIFITSKLYCPETIEDEIRPKNRGLQEKASSEIKNLLDEFEVNYTNLGENPVHEVVLILKKLMK